MSDPIHVAFAVDRGYFDQVAVTIASIVANSSRPDDLCFHVIHAEDEEWARDQVKRWATPVVDTVRIENPFTASGTVLEYVSVATWLRILLPLALPLIDRVIYLDADLVVLRDIQELWNADLGSAAIGGVVDIGIYRNLVRGDERGDHRSRDHLLGLGLDPQRHEYINAGVLIMDLDRLRGQDFSRAAWQMFERRSDGLDFADQDVINALLLHQVVLLDPRWNVLAMGFSRAGLRHIHYVPRALRGSLEQQRTNPWIVHYAGAMKPWDNAEVWRGDEWWHYAPLSGLKRSPPTPSSRTVATILRDVWLDLRSKLSRWQFQMRNPSV